MGEAGAFIPGNASNTVAIALFLIGLGIVGFAVLWARIRR
jgi:hypothetical protein